MKASRKTKKQGKKQGPKKRSEDRRVFMGFHGDEATAKAIQYLAKSEDRSTSSVLRRMVAEMLRKNELVLDKDGVKVDI